MNLTLTTHQRFKVLGENGPKRLFRFFQEKVYSEQLRVIEEKGEEVDWDALCRMEYLERFIKETMRLFPVITVIGRQISAELTVGKSKMFGII